MASVYSLRSIFSYANVGLSSSVLESISLFASLLIIKLSYRNLMFILQTPSSQPNYKSNNFMFLLDKLHLKPCFQLVDLLFQHMFWTPSYVNMLQIRFTIYPHLHRNQRYRLRRYQDKKVSYRFQGISLKGYGK